ncbi:MAG: aldo/keto reductase [Ignavibacteriaceae bacterium]|nr:aldo/keto reductase [Ignavibacteriaceae bacterium]
MKYREIGKTGIKVSEIGLGCWTMGGLNWVNGVPNGWANVDEGEIRSAIDYAIEQGVNHFDNADVYGNGKAERMLAKILGKRSNNFFIATKVGWFPGTAAHAYEPQHIRHQCEQSLVNLNRDHIDLYYFHHGNFGESDMYLDDAVDTIYKLKSEGKIRFIGQSAYSHDDFVKLIPKVNPDAIQSSASALDYKYLADGSPTRRLLEEKQISFIAFGPIAQGLLLGKYSKENPPAFEPGDHRANAQRFSKENLERLDPLIAKLKERFGSDTRNLAGAALQFLLHFSVTGAVIPGFRSLDQVKINLAAADFAFSDEDFYFVKDLFSQK